MKSNPQIWTILLLIAVLIIGGALLHKDSRHGTQKPIVIGAVLGQTGDAAIDSLNIQRGMELAKDDLAQKGILVEFKYADDQTDSAKTVLAAQQIIAADHPQAFIGFTWDFQLDAVTPILNQAQIPAYSPANTSGVANARSPYVFFGAPLNETKIEPTAQFLKEHHITKAAIGIQNSAWGVNHIAVYKQAAAEAGTTIVSTDKSEYGQEMSALPTFVTKLKHNGAQALLWSGGQTGSNILLAEMERQNVNIPVLGEVQIENAVANGTVQKLPNTHWYVYKTNTATEFVQKFKAKYDQEPGLYADIAYDGVMILSEATTHTDGSPQQIAAYLREGKVQYHGYSVDQFRFDEKGGLISGTYHLEEVK
jgi:branched-chain amino acid transport system substrate-binding protein